MQNPSKVLLVTAGLIILHSTPGWSETGLKLTQPEAKNEITKLQTNQAYIEKIAREKFMMAKPGEKIFKVVNYKKVTQ